LYIFFFRAEDGIRDFHVTGVQTCALPIYVIALVFLLFDVELIFVFPWATVFGSRELVAADGRWGWFTLVEMGMFLGILVVGLVYVWKRGDISWIKPAHVQPRVSVGIPAAAYEQLNNKKYHVRDYKETI